MIRKTYADFVVSRAVAATGRRIRYSLGQGGFHPEDLQPTRTGLCDCSGAAAHWSGLNRSPKPKRPWWFETTNVYKDATSGKADSTFVKLDKPEAGCLIVYPDRYLLKKKIGEGHVAVCTFYDAHTGKIIGVDCSSGSSKKTGDAIPPPHDLTWMVKKRKAIAVTLREQIEK